MKCPSCKRGRLRQQVSVFIECSADCRFLNKKEIRSKDVQILGAGWSQATIFCTNEKCGYVLRFK